MGRNTKRPNTTKGPIKPKQKHYKNYKRVLILRSEANLRSLSKGIGHHSINCYDDPEPRLHQREWSIIFLFNKCLFQLNFWYEQYWKWFSSVFLQKVWFGHNAKAIQIIPSPWIINKQLKKVIGIEDRKKTNFSGTRMKCIF